MTKERKLSKAELLRKEAFDVENERRIAEGYERHDLTVSVSKANWLGFVMSMPFVLVLMGLFAMLTPMDYEGWDMAEASFFPLGTRMTCRFSQPEKASCPMLVTLSGMVMAVSPVQL